MKYTPKLAAYYRDMWAGLSILPVKRNEAVTFAKKILANKARYQRIEKATGVPWHFVALAHYRESTLNFGKNLCNGQPLGMRTTIVPKGHGPYKSFEESAYDALVTIKGYSAKMDWAIAPYCYRIEGYNGYGYHGKGIPSPYLVGGSNKWKRGKYIRDHVYDPTHWDTQLGVLTLLKALMELDPSIKFDGATVSQPKPAPAPPPPPDVEEKEDEEDHPEAIPSPKADDGTKPAVKSKTVWASIIGVASSILAVVTDWRVLVALAVILFLFILADRVLKLDIKGWFRS